MLDGGVPMVGSGDGEGDGLGDGTGDGEGEGDGLGLIPTKGSLPLKAGGFFDAGFRVGVGDGAG